MNKTTLQAIISGLCFGLWPLLLNRAGLNWALSINIIQALGLCVVLPFTIHYGLAGIEHANWTMMFSAAFIGIIGIIIFNRMIITATKETVGQIFVFMIIFQTASPVIFQLLFSGKSLSVTKTIGLILAFIAALLLQL